MVRCNRGIDAQLLDIDPEDMPSDDSDDPDYTEGETSDEDDLPKRFERDRADWIVKYSTELEYCYKVFKEVGVGMFGSAFFQCGTVNKFSNMVYKYTMPGADSSK
tara:strand:- start:1269 stop:1583 length:315 start_codon:yes stop_codon:yes gene_type:complete